MRYEAREFSGIWTIYDADQAGVTHWCENEAVARWMADEANRLGRIVPGTPIPRYLLERDQD